MSKLTVAELIGETPEMLKLCGRILTLEYGKPSMTAKTYRANMRSLRHHLALMQSMQRDSVRGPMTAEWSDTDLNALSARHACEDANADGSCWHTDTSRDAIRFTGLESGK